MSDIKTQLKNARGEIKNKNFNNSIKICQTILDQDASNYMALIFLGLSLQESGCSDECEKVFKKAISLNPNNPLGWNGLASYYEKIDSTLSKQELIKIYKKLIEIETTEEKIVKCCNKLCALHKYGTIHEICYIIYTKLKCEDFSEDAVCECNKVLADTLKQYPDLPSDILDIYEEVLENSLSKNNALFTTYHSDFLTLLSKRNKQIQLLDSTLSYYNFFPTELVPIRWICFLYNTFFVENNLSMLSSLPNVEDMVDILLKVNEKDVEGLFCKSVLLVSKNGDLEKARAILNEVITLEPKKFDAWIMLATVNLKQLMYQETIEASEVAYNLLEPSSNKVVIFKVTDILLESLSQSMETDDWEKVEEYFNEIKDSDLKNACMPHLIRSYLKLGKLKAAEGLLVKHTKDCANEDAWQLLRAQLFHKNLEYKKALALLEKRNVQTPEWLFEIGLIYYELHDFRRCKTPFLKAAQLAPNNYLYFYYLGNLYHELDDLDKSRRCYEKSLKLCDSFMPTAKELSKLYVKLRNWDANFALLHRLSSETVNERNCWVWLQRGLSAMDKGDYQKSIDNLQLVLRVNPQNVHCWEALADAYLARGAYISAQKAFEKVLELSGTKMYPLLQIATIKKILGKYMEAIEDYESILRDNTTSVLTLKGLAETYFFYGKQCYREQRIGTSRDYIQKAVDKLGIAIKERWNLVCLWKMLGDSCVFIAQLPDKFCCLMVLCLLEDGVTQNGYKMLFREDLLKMATRSYSKALSVDETNWMLWHDLGCCYLNEAVLSENQIETNDCIQKASAIAEYCVKNNPLHWEHWNLLGNAAMQLDPPNYALAQHAFIKAVTINHNNAMAWTNLGVIYLIKQCVKLANTAFAQAQTSDPNYVSSWIGQALLAEFLEHEDAMDLFRHSAQLAPHQQGALGYGHWVCRTLIEEPASDTKYVIQNMHAIPVACDALCWYTEKNPYNPCAWNMLGILKERMGLTLSAKIAYENALKMSAKEHNDLVRINYGRILIKLKDYQQAISVCSAAEESSYNIGIWYALALYKDKRFEEASNICSAIIQYLSKNETSVCDVVASRAIIDYMRGEVETARKTLVESFTKQFPSAQVMFTLIALGVLQKDTRLVMLALHEVELLKDVVKNLESFITLLSLVHISQEDHLKAIRKINQLIHLFPDRACLWYALSITMLRSMDNLSSPKESSEKSAYKAAKLALLLKDTKSDYKTVARMFCAASMSATSLLKYKSALILVQKALHCAPNFKECWVIFIHALRKFPNTYDCKVYQQVLCEHYKEYSHIQENKIF